MDSDKHSETLVNVRGHYTHWRLLLCEVGYRRWWQMGTLSGLHSLI